MTAMTLTTIASFSVRGLATPKWHGMILMHLKKQRAAKAFLQKTHLMEAHASLLRECHYRVGFYSPSPDKKSRGVSIILSNFVLWMLTDMLQDGEEHFLFVKGHLVLQDVALATAYFMNSNLLYGIYLRRLG